MIAGLFKESSSFSKLLFSLFVIVAGFTLFTGLGMLCAYFFFGVGLEGLAGKIDPLMPENIPVLKFLQACFSIGLFVFPPLVIAFMVSGNTWAYLKLNRTPVLTMVLLSLILVLVALPLVNYLVMLNEKIHFPDSMKFLEDTFKKMENEAGQTTTAFLKASGLGAYLVNLLVIALIPAVGEELLFRGVFQRLFHEWSRNIHLAIWVTAFVFSAMHLQFYGFFPRMLLGAMFGYLFYWSGNLWLPIIAHFINNSFAVSFFYANDRLAKKAEQIGTSDNSMFYVFLSVFLLISIMYLVYRLGKEQLTKSKYDEI